MLFVSYCNNFFKLKYIAKEDLLVGLFFTTPFFFNYVLFDPFYFQIKEAISILFHIFGKMVTQV